MLINRGKWQNSFYFMNSFKFFIVSEKFLMKEEKKRREEDEAEQRGQGCCVPVNNHRGTTIKSN